MSMSLSTPSFNKPFDKIAAFDVSEPLAGIVVMMLIGSALSGFAFPEKKSQQSPSYGIPRAIAFAVSIALPPPTASTKSIERFLPKSENSLTSSIFGFGTTRGHSKSSAPIFRHAFSTMSYMPSAFGNLPPETSKRDVTRYSCKRESIFSSFVSPKIILAGFFQSKPIIFASRKQSYHVVR